ncbi:MAG: iron-sulfur cluster assembly scaffold protein [Pyrinomonadaceae bacterium]
MIYPEAFKIRLTHLAHCRELADANANGTGVNLACGSMVRFFLRIEQDGRVAEAAFRSNGCGHSRAAADVLAAWVNKKRLVDLHGLDGAEMLDAIQSELTKIPSENIACVAAATSALKDAFADYRARRIEEFRGEDTLICTCFGVTEARIEDLIAKSQAKSVEQITSACNAGGGCGSCRMLIQEILDSVL